ncbi:unnamed protein product [Phytophthora fragariaefolia]|uniref:Unnamed protein product n=1 Tax=Phytophthora fragariaefolia TaxID=1490495 RepID=A0A9W6X760_9STRA|nr:unnamed protein product [Phytophthora fragariaefolia]
MTLDESTVVEEPPSSKLGEYDAEEDDPSDSQGLTVPGEDPPISGEDAVQAVLDLAVTTEDQAVDGEEEEDTHLTHSDGNGATLAAQEQFTPMHMSVQGEDEKPDSAAVAEPSTELPTHGDEGPATVTEILDIVTAPDELAQDANAEDDASTETAVVTDILDAVVASPSSDEQLQSTNDGIDDPIGVEEELLPSTSPPTGEAIVACAEVVGADLLVIPPPAPTAVPVIVGSMNPIEDDNDDSDDSQDEDDDKSTPLPSSLQLNDPDDDEDVLEVDEAVVGTIEIEEKQRMEKGELSKSDQQGAKTLDIAAEADNALLKALPIIKTDDTSAVGLSLGEEIRVAHVTTLEPSSPSSDIHKMAGGAPPVSKLSTDTAFGISYQSIRRKIDEPNTTADEHGYSLPSGPAFPDEREFENEMEMASDLSFSVATVASSSPSKSGDLVVGSDEDEFAFDIKPAAELNSLSEDELRARRESLENQKRKEEEELLKELKRATDEEKRIIESSHTTESGPSDATGVTASESDALSLTELHNIYKRGLGDQEVLMDENDAAEKTENPQIVRSMSVMGRIFSQAQGPTETIAEEVDGGDSEHEDHDDNHGGINNVNIDDGNTEDTKTVTEKSDADEASAWREIKLVQHRQPQEQSESTKNNSSSESASVSRISYAEAAGYYAETPDVMQNRDIIVSEDFPRGSCLTCLSRPRLTFAGAIEERDRVFCIAATAFDAHNDVVVGMLQTIYRKITKTPRDVFLIGRHWEDIGFQGTDPSTDLRGCGVLSLLQTLYLVDTYPDLAHRFHTLSQHPTRHFPFACVLINVTLQCVVSLRNGVLYSECNKHASVLSGMNRLYIALVSQLHDTIQSRSDEIPLILKDVLGRGGTNPEKVIDEAFDGAALRPSRPAASATSNSKTKGTDRKETDNNLEFTEIGLHSVDEEP